MICLFFSELFPHDPNLFVGSALNLTCKINLSHPELEGNYDARNIYFELHETNINNTYVTVNANYSEAYLSYPNVSQEYDEKYIKCFVDTGPDLENHIFVASQHICVGCEYT